MALSDEIFTGDVAIALDLAVRSRSHEDILSVLAQVKVLNSVALKHAAVKSATLK